MSKYIKPDCELGYVEDNAEINYLKFNNLRHTILGCMLGDFIEEGEYVVDPEIVKELISMPKYVVETMENVEVCVSELKLDKQISFLVTFEEDKATLSLIEKLSYEANFKLNSGTYSNINEYIIDQVQTSGEINRNVLYRKWNISQYEGTVVDIFNCDDSVLEKYFGIVNRFKYLLVANNLLLNKEGDLEEIEAEYANQIFSLLRRFPEFEKVILEKLTVAFKEKQDFLQLDKPNYVKTLNEILDNTIQQNINILTDEQKQEIYAELRNIYLQIYMKRIGVIDIETINGIETLSVKQLLSASLQEIGAEFVKNVNGYKQIDRMGKAELKKLMDYLVAQKLIEIKKAEEKKVEELIKKTQEKVAEQAKAKAEAASADKPKAKGGDKAKAKSKDDKKKDNKKSSEKSNSKDDKKKEEEERKKKEEEERKKKEEEERRKAAARRKKRKYGYSTYGYSGMIASRVVKEKFSVGVNGTIEYAKNTNVGVSGGGITIGVTKKEVGVGEREASLQVGVGKDAGLGV